MFRVSGVEFALAADVVQRQYGQMGKVLPDVTVFAAACDGTHGVHVKGSVVKRLVIGHFAAAVEVKIAAVITDEIACFAPAAVFFAQLAEQVDAQQDILLVAADAT